jgi:hypothetical protein
VNSYMDSPGEDIADIKMRETFRALAALR